MNYKWLKKSIPTIGSIAVVGTAMGVLGVSLQNEAGVRVIKDKVYKDAMEFTNKGDILVLFHDEVSGVQAIDEAEKLSKDSGGKDFEGFTGYLNSMSAGSFTITGAPGIVSGGAFNPYFKQVKHHDMDFKTWDKYLYQNAIKKYNKSSKINKLAYVNSQVLNDTSNWRNNTVFGRSFAPDNTTFTSSAELLKHDGSKFYETTEDHYKFWNDLPDKMTINKNATKKNVKYLFSETTHIKEGAQNYLVHDTSTKSDVGKNSSGETMYERQALDEALESDNKLFKKLKKENLYDDMTIIIVSDHGSHQRPWKFYEKDTEDFYKDYTKKDSVIRKLGGEYEGIFRVNSTLLVKPPAKKAPSKNYDKATKTWKPLDVDKTTFTTNGDVNQFINLYNDLNIDWSEKSELSNYAIDPTTPNRTLNSFKVFWYVYPTKQYHYYDFARKYMQFNGSINNISLKDLPLDELPDTFHDSTFFHDVKGLDDDGFGKGLKNGVYGGINYNGTNDGKVVYSND